MNPSAEWSLLNDKFYRKYEVYAMLWDSIDLSKFIVACAPNGGPIGILSAYISHDSK